MRYVLVALVLLASSVFAQSAGEAEMVFNREYNDAKAVFNARVKAAQDKFVAVLKVEMQRLTQKGDLDGALAIKEKIKSLASEETTNESKFVGRWMNKKGLIMNITYNNKKYVMSEEGSNRSSSNFKQINSNTILFQWDKNGLYSVEINKDDVNITCWKVNITALPEKIPDGQFWWSDNCKKVTDK